MQQKVYIAIQRAEVAVSELSQDQRPEAVQKALREVLTAVRELADVVPTITTDAVSRSVKP